MAEAANTAPGSEKKPGVPMTQAAPLNDESKNVFTELFGKDASQKGTSVMNTVTTQQEKKTSFFGSKPKEDESLSLKKLREHPSRPGAAMLKASVLIFALTAGAFLTQNSSHFSFFGVNPALRVEQAQDRVADLTANAQVRSHLEAALLLDQFMSKADEYFYNLDQAESEYSSENDKQDYQEKVDELEPEITTLIGKVQQNFNRPLSDTEFAGAVAVADTLISELKAQSGQVDEQTLLQDIQDLETAKNLMGQVDFKNIVLAVDLTKITEENLHTIYEQFSGINSSVTAIISKLKTDRKEWSFYLEELESRTEEVYALFNTEFSKSLTLDEVRFISDGTVLVTGSTSTDDSKNFTLVSDLIDEYEDSEYFKDVEERSYNKNNQSEEYTGNFRIELTLEQ